MDTRGGKKRNTTNSRQKTKTSRQKNIEQIVKAGGLDNVLNSENKPRKWLVKEIKAMAKELNVSVVGAGNVLRPKVMRALETLVAQAVANKAIEAAATTVQQQHKDLQKKAKFYI